MRVCLAVRSVGDGARRLGSVTMMLGVTERCRPALFLFLRWERCALFSGTTWGSHGYIIGRIVPWQSNVQLLSV